MNKERRRALLETLLVIADPESADLHTIDSIQTDLQALLFKYFSGDRKVKVLSVKVLRARREWVRKELAAGKPVPEWMLKYKDMDLAIYGLPETYEKDADGNLIRPNPFSGHDEGMNG